MKKDKDFSHRREQLSYSCNVLLHEKIQTFKQVLEHKHTILLELCKLMLHR